jgi:hypothetical protein
MRDKPGKSSSSWEGRGAARNEATWRREQRELATGASTYDVSDVSGHNTVPGPTI